MTSERHVILISGKDSLATAIVQTRRKPEIDYEYVHNPTGWDLPPVIEWIERVGKFFGTEIKQVGDDLTEIAHEEGILPSPKVRYCTRLAKIKPLQDYLGTADTTCYFGLRADEPERVGYQRSKKDTIKPCYPLREEGYGIVEVWNLCKQVDLLPPQFHWQWMEDRVRHLLGSDQFLIEQLNEWERASLFAWRSRSNCSVCFNQRLYEIVGLNEHFPECFELGKKLENEIGAEGFTWKKGMTWDDIVNRADEIKEKRARAIFGYLRTKQQRLLFVDDGLIDVLQTTSCGLLCGK